MNKMNPQVKEKWIDALRSGKYEQGSEKLRSVDGYCCLGVLCDLYAQEQNKEWDLKGIDEENHQVMDYWYFDGESEFLPDSVREWAGITFNNPKVRVDVTENDDEDDWFYQDEIANLNDTGYTFEELSKLIQEQF
ncbi:MAG: hypothetical protein EBU66_19235 [Bacteroidetes bacterium]|nr:hypothetical protein [bacterium]NBP66768.1 hypothetical protein [Bacteroidota bacterium]